MLPALPFLPNIMLCQNNEAAGPQQWSYLKHWCMDVLAVHNGKEIHQMDSCFSATYFMRPSLQMLYGWDANTLVGWVPQHCQTSRNLVTYRSAFPGHLVLTGTGFSTPSLPAMMCSFLYLAAPSTDQRDNLYSMAPIMLTWRLTWRPSLQSSL